MVSVAGVGHGIRDVSEGGCTVLYLYLEDETGGG
jgi:hypothetical protein